MTVPSTKNVKTHVGNGVTTVFPFDFRIFEAEDLEVSLTLADGTVEEWVLGTDFTVPAKWEDVQAGGEIIATTAPASGTTLAIKRVLDLLQQTDLRNQGDFLAEVIEDQFDRFAMQDQQISEVQGRTLQRPLAGGGWNALGYPIKNLGASVDPNDAVRKSELSAFATGVIQPLVDEAENYRDQAGTYAGQAAGSATTASNAATTATNKLTEFQGQYYGAYASDPTEDPNGNPPGAGDLYFSTTAPVGLRGYDADAGVWRELGNNFQGIYDRRDYVVPAGGEDTFAVTYEGALVEVIVNGDVLPRADYTATSGTDVVMGSLLPEGTEVTVIGLGKFDVADVTNALVTSASGTQSIGTALNDRVLHVPDIAALRALTGVQDGQRVSVTEYLSDIAGGHSEYYWDSARPKSDHTGSSVISPTVPWDGSAASLDDFQDGVGETDPGGNGCWISLAELEKASDWGISPDNPDNLPALLNFIGSTRFGSDARYLLCPPLKFDTGTYNFSGPLDVRARVVFVGDSSPESLSSEGTIFQFPESSGDGVVLHRFNTTGNGAILSPTDSGADGSIVSGITIRGAGSETRAAVYDYDAVKGLIVYRGDLPAGDFDAYDIDNPNYETAVIGTFSASGTEVAVRPLPARKIVGTFTEGETVTGGTSGATATASFVSSRYSVLMASSVSGTFSEGETITGGTSGATARVYAPLQGTGYNISDISSVTGSLLGDQGLSLVKPSGQHGSGVVQFCAASLVDVRVQRWIEHGVKIATAGSAGYATGNANRFCLQKVWVDGVGGHGVFAYGGDSNAGAGTQVNAQKCGGYSINDRSFLGNDWAYCHSSANLLGAYKSDDNADRSTNFIGCYSEADQERIPFPEYASVVNGASTVYGGTQGARVIPNINDSYEVLGNVNFDGRRGFNFRGLHYGSIGSNLTGVQLKVRSKSTDTAQALVVENTGNFGVTRGTSLGFRVPFENDTSLPAAEIIARGGNYGAELRFAVKPNRRQGTRAVVSGSGGSGASIELTISGGVIVDAQVLTGGSGYPLDSTISIDVIPGDAAGTGADLVPVINNGRLTDVIIVSGGSGYTDNQPVEKIQFGKDAISPVDDAAYDSGQAAARWANSYSEMFRPGSGAPTWTSGTGSPEGAVSASPGSLYTNESGGAGATLYVKESGTGSTGWVAK